MSPQKWSCTVRNFLLPFLLFLVGCSSQNNQPIVSYSTKVPLEVSLYGIDVKNGDIAWYHPPITVINDTDQHIEYQQNYPSVVVRDFFIAAEITWESESQASGCGFSLRTHGRYENPSRYIIYISREPYIHIHFAAFSQGKLANIRDMYNTEINPSFEWKNGTSNHVAVKGIGHLLTVYLNHSKIGIIDITTPPTQDPGYPPPPDQTPDMEKIYDEKFHALEETYQETLAQISKKHRNIEFIFNLTRPIFYEGYIGFSAINTKGSTICLFENAWLWEFKQSDLKNP